MLAAFVSSKRMLALYVVPESAFWLWPLVQDWCWYESCENDPFNKLNGVS